MEFEGAGKTCCDFLVAVGIRPSKPVLQDLRTLPSGLGEQAAHAQPGPRSVSASFQVPESPV